MTNQQGAPAAVAGCTRSHPHENMDSACRAKAAIAEMQNLAARGAEATAHDLARFVSMLTAALVEAQQPAPAATPGAVPDAAPGGAGSTAPAARGPAPGTASGAVPGTPPPRDAPGAGGIIRNAASTEAGAPTRLAARSCPAASGSTGASNRLNIQAHFILD